MEPENKKSNRIPHWFRFTLETLWSPQTVISRTQYFWLGVLFFAIKYNLDRAIAAFVFGRSWNLLDYLTPLNVLELLPGFTSTTTFPMGSSTPLNQFSDQQFYLSMAAIALPFAWIGLNLTIRRLNDLKISPYWSLLFFIPFINLLMFLVLSLLPSNSASLPQPDKKPLHWRLLDRILPRGKIGSALVGTLLAPLLGIAGLTFVIDHLGGIYGLGLFLGLPFCMGLLSVLVYSYHEVRSLRECLLVASLAMIIMGTAILMLAFEGIICLIMAAPIAVILGLLGGATGYALQKTWNIRYRRDHLMTFLALVLSWPLFTGAESKLVDKPPVYSVESLMEINAPPETVWHNVVSFSQLPQPKEWIFQTGIAYPIRARIEGQGLGAIRHCIFSTGEFVEPIEVWDKPYKLGFGVKTMPMPMHEWSYKEIHPPHLDQYLQVTHGEFKLERLPGNKTRLLGTTWYSNRVWPSAYWKVWSDMIIHAIHLRVLEHIKTLSEERA